MAENEQYLEKAVRYLVREGYDDITGYLKGNIENWYSAGLPIESLKLISANDLKAMLDSKEDILRGAISSLHSCIADMFFLKIAFNDTRLLLAAA